MVGKLTHSWQRTRGDLESGASRVLAPKANGVRRRGSVLILVMTLLGVLFVTGLAFLATMNFEANMIDVERQNDRNDAGIVMVLDAVGSILRESLVGPGGAPYTGRLERPFGTPTSGNAPNAQGEIPGLDNLIAPIEPYRPDPRIIDTNWRSFTDLKRATARPRELLLPRDLSLAANWESGWPRPDETDTPPGSVGEDFAVDSDGDGITDTVQFDLLDLGFSRAQVTRFAAELNTQSKPDGSVFLGMRIIPHGGMVNLNESHPNLIANLMNLLDINGKLAPEKLADAPTADNNFFRHSPSSRQQLYSPWTEEAGLRRRVLLPPRMVSPSLLMGNPFLDPRREPHARGDMFAKLLPPAPGAPFGPEFETAYEGRHRFAPFTFEEPFDGDYPSLWAVRMEPFLSFEADRSKNAYDLRHLTTTISHDNLLARGGRAPLADPRFDISLGDRELRELMIRANQKAVPFGPLDVLPFEYANYPDTLPNEPTGFCENAVEKECRFDPRKGRLKLSLAYIDDQLVEADTLATTDLAAADLIRRRMQRLIHDAFFMLVRNAKGRYWADIDCDAANPCPGRDACSTLDGLCHDFDTLETHRQALLSRTAASLTANLIDYMDANDVPTRVALRSMDSSDLSTFGRDLAVILPDAVAPTRQYVYGLEQQPYITEVATEASVPPAASAGTPPTIDGRAIEIYNPYNQDTPDSPGTDEYFFMEVDPGGSAPPHEVPLGSTLRAEQLTVFHVGLPGAAPLPGNTPVPLLSSPFQFLDGWIIYLVRRVHYLGDDLPTDIVVDQFLVGGPDAIGIGKIPPPGPALQPGDKAIFSMERVLRNPEIANPWTMTVPDAVEGSVGDESLGDWNERIDSKGIRPVEVNFANTGSFTQPGPKRCHAGTVPGTVCVVDADCGRDGTCTNSGIAFPTTGSMLLTMRHANRSFDEFDPDTDVTDLAFTTWLTRNRVEVTTQDDPLKRITTNIEEFEQTDNGRMPIFDLVSSVITVPGEPDRRVFAHHVDPAKTDQRKPGDLSMLPWGQLVFDYFTVLPLSGSGPFITGDLDAVGLPSAQPRVDLEGLRVHGRININAAPIKVLAGLPFIPMEMMPFAFRGKVRFGAGLLANAGAMTDPFDPIVPDAEKGLLVFLDEEAGIMGDQLAAGVVAYREQRVLPGSGDYGGVGGRAWDDIPGKPAFRRGPGFLTVGELANVRHTAAADDRRIEGGNTGKDPLDEDYVLAVARLVALGDWVTTSSDVFTIYGTLRGEIDEEVGIGLTDEFRFRAQAADVDARAIRFQETIDRLPTFLGRPLPSRLGQRTVGKYVDLRND